VDPADDEVIASGESTASAISLRPTPPAAAGRPKKLFYPFSSSVASSDDCP